MNFSDKFNTKFDHEELRQKLKESVRVMENIFLPIIQDLEDSDLYNETYKFHYRESKNLEEGRKNFQEIKEHLDKTDGIKNPIIAENQTHHIAGIFLTYANNCTVFAKSLAEDASPSQNELADIFIQRFEDAKNELTQEKQKLINWGCEKRIIKGGYYDVNLGRQ